MEKKYTIKFNNGAFIRQDQTKNFTYKSKKFNSLINEMNYMVDELDRFDDFEKLKISPDRYQKINGVYGITKTNEHGRDVIYDYQQTAAKDFLKELRGFGLLADVVGSGKTFEACVVLSELAQRNKIRSLIFIVPKQVIPDWIKTVELYFGLGEGKLLHLKNNDSSKKAIFFDDKEIEVEMIGGYKVPRRPIIISDEDFSKLDNSITNYLFDCIVVDEAHHLCDEKAVYSKTMNRLSSMIQIKKKAQRPYCLLLSATPHSGNLEHMFKLWYFIRCTGGNPDDFINDNKTDEYNKEKEYYLSIVCRKAKTVMQFIEIVKKYECENKYKDQYYKFVADKYNINEYASLPDGKKNEIVNAFLDANEEIHEVVTKTVATAYHNGVLRTIMIRNPRGIRNSNERRRIEKNIVNYLIFPTNKKIPDSFAITDSHSENKGIVVYPNKLDTNNAIFYDNRYYSLEGYVKETTNDNRYSTSFAKLVREVLANIDDIDNDKSDKCLFEKKHSSRYYEERMRKCESRIDNKLVVTSYKNNDLFTDKYQITKQILNKHNNERVIIFFDYDAKHNKDSDENYNVIQQFVKQITKDYSSRVIVGKVKNTEQKEKIEEEFNAKEDAILVVCDEALTEGTNLQKSSIIINFEITPDPVALDQRIGRIFRLGQKKDVTIYSLTYMNRLEGYSLMYFSSIGLLTSNSGDATIIAGSNSENMIAVRCSCCGNVKLMSHDDYEFNKTHEGLYCDDETCMKTRSKEQRLMSEIAIENYKCDSCGEALVRSNNDDLYKCMSSSGYNDTSRFMKSLDFGKKFTCQKICAMGNCDKFREDERNGIICPVLEAYRDNKYISPASLVIICSRCKRADCKPECKYTSGIEGCKKCDHATCHPKPHTIVFNEKHEARCPNCKDGYLRPVQAATFGAYIQKAWDFKNDKGASFCTNLTKEADKVAEIKRILDCDGKGDN